MGLGHRDDRVYPVMCNYQHAGMSVECQHD